MKFIDEEVIWEIGQKNLYALKSETIHLISAVQLELWNM